MTPLIALSTLSLLGYHLTFDAEMTQPSDMSQFINTFANGDTTLWNNNEAEMYMPYSPSDASCPMVFQNGALVLSAALTSTGDRPYTSGMLETSGIFAQSSGYFEMRAATPAAPGFWPAFWLLPSAYYPEIDVMEQPNNSGSNTQYWTHTSTPTDSSGGFSDMGVDVTHGFHRYGFLWTANSIQYVFDGTLVGWPHALPPSMVGLPMYLIANLAVGGPYSWPGAPPAGAASTFSIDYIRVFSNDPTVPSVPQAPISSPDGLNTLPVLMPPPPPVPPTLGTGPDTLVLNMAEDAYQGDAQFSVTVDGRKYGGVLSAQANNAVGQTQPFTLRGSFGTARHSVAVSYLNDFSDSNGDRNLYMASATLDGRVLPGVSLAEYNNTTLSFGFSNKPVQPVSIGSGPDVLTFDLSAVPNTANARFSIAVDGVAQGADQVVSALHAYAQTQPFVVHGTFGPAAHTITLGFITGAAPGATSTPSQLYVDALSYNGIAIPNAATGFSNTGKYTIQSAAQQADTLSLNLTEDAWQGDAIAQVSVDGRVLGQVTVTASNAGAPQNVTYSGGWGGPNIAHAIQVSFLNDAYGGPGQDRNLHVQAMTLDGAAVISQPQNLMLGGPVTFSTVPPAGAGWVVAPQKPKRAP